MRHHVRSLRRPLLLAAAASLVGACAAPGPEPRRANAFLADEGAREFARHCASCHGAGGQGDGPAGTALATPPADLTRIAARRDGHFPRLDVAYVIDGRFEVQAHGTREMPVWGTRFLEGLPQDELGDAIVRGRIETLVEYLESIQVPR